MAAIVDGPPSPLFHPVTIRSGRSLAKLPTDGLSKEMAEALEAAPTGNCVCRGIAFRVGRAVLVNDRPVTVRTDNLRARWLVFLHTSDIRPLGADENGLISPTHGIGRLGEHAADYVIVYADGRERRLAVRRRQQIGAFARPWGENCTEAVAHHKPRPLPSHGSETNRNADWGRLQTRASSGDGGRWVNWLWAWRNPRPRKAIAAIRFQPVCGTVVVSGVSAGRASAHPLRWRTRRKAVLKLARGEALDPTVDDHGRFRQVQLDMGQVISAQPRLLYPQEDWAKTYNNRLPEVSARQVLVEYTSHRDARFHLGGGRTRKVATVESASGSAGIRPVRAATQRVTVRILERRSRKRMAVKLHVHGECGEYLCPIDRHRIPNPWWFQDYSVDFTHCGIHPCTYVDGETVMDLPLGRVYVEVSKGFEIRPVRKVVRVTRRTTELVIEIEKVLPWRERGWVSADTHVHFLSPPSAQLEGAGEGVNVVNLLASQWGELMTNVGDFDGRTTFGQGARRGGRARRSRRGASSRSTGSELADGEYLVRVGTENRQHVMGHISLLGYEGPIIAPMTTGGPDESAIGDAVEVLLTEWARQCRRQKGVVILPHFPNPRLENAATIVDGAVDGVEMTAWGNLYGGISPYSLSDWYRYLNCGYFVAAVGGTDKMSAQTAVGAVRTYARVGTDGAFTYEAWKAAVRRGETFVTYGPLLEFAVEGKPAGSRIRMGPSGGTIDATWQVASVTVPMSRIELVVNGEIRRSRALRGDEDRGHWSVKLDRSSWLAVLVRGHYEDKPEIIAAHSSPVMVEVKGSEFFAAADALTILEQIEGALAYLDTVGTRARTAAYKRMRIVLTGAHRRLHNRMHRLGYDHKHTPADDHAEHH